MSTPTKLDVAQLRRQVESGAGPRLIDVRTPAEFETAHIPGSYNVPLDLLREHRDELRAHLDEQVVLICRTGRRAVEAEQALAAAGLPNLRLLDGGIVAWQAAGGEVRHGEPRWELERQVRLVAGAIVLTAVLVGVLVPPVTWLAGLVGAGLVVASLTDTCLMGMLLAKLPCNRGPRTTFPAVVAALSDGSG
ncbi:rhodanese-like domain-containing protein [Lentzea sp. BCCO 10_0798]|uniref:Rhodanese-like domain-containing protein n=1 Tax=Lentzea kristufekii TaxID=3095430 RepID=A0ABU4TV51_9PSEU|nr:rhodanese-like domain-containing protein [Lentzea sp. BCCO 10_0798]MDX8052189.1 rhodanese-like domain-containing protein [Lentzea sp. BCCO 10_0798]